jgi:GT2 family glycosyltransferase
MESKRNIGFAAANNRAALAASGKFLLFLNPDAILDRGAISLMIKEAERLGAGAVAGRMRNPDGSFQPTCRNFPTMRNIFFSRGSILRRLIPSKSIVYTLGDFAETTEIPAAAATCLLMEREFFLRLGGFDPRFFLYMEDTDLCLRVHQAGRKIYFIPSAGGAHYWGESSPISEAGRSWRHHISVWKYFIKHYPGGFSLFVMPVALAANLIGGLILNRRRGKRAN